VDELAIYIMDNSPDLEFLGKGQRHHGKALFQFSFYRLSAPNKPGAMIRHHNQQCVVEMSRRFQVIQEVAQVLIYKSKA